MMNLFKFTEQDQSLCYLQKIFGTMHNVIVTPPGGCGRDPATDPSTEFTTSLLGAMFQTFNTVILAVGALIVVYITIVGVMATAHEGKFMGEKWNGLWTPLRTVIGIAALVPLGSGYSAIQIILMWVIVQGIGAADTLWSTTLGAIQVFGSPFASPTLSSLDVSQNMESLFKSLVCDVTAKETRADPANITGGGYYCNQTPGVYCTTAYTIPNKDNNLPLGPKGQCGTLTYCNLADACKDNANSLSCLSCQAQIAALQEVVPALENTAKAFEEADYTYRDFYYHTSNDISKSNPSWTWIYNYCNDKGLTKPEECCVKSNSDQPQLCVSSAASFFDPNNKSSLQSPSEQAVQQLYFPYAIQPEIGGSFVETATNYYMDLIVKALNTYVALKGQEGNLDPDLALAHINGWILAGSYYYAIGKLNSNNVNDALPPFKVSPADITGDLSKVRNNSSAAADLVTIAKTASAPSTPSSGGGGGVGTVTKLSSSSSNPMAGPLLNNLTDALNTTANAVRPNQGGGAINPMAQLQTAGYSMLAIAQTIFVVFMTITFILGIAGNINVWVLGNTVENPLGPTAELMYFVLVPLIFALLGYLITIGGLLGIYVPLIPFIVFTTGVIGWFLGTIETMVAGPLVALGILSPSAHGHELLGKAEHALTMIFNIFLRPSLMIFGLMTAMLLSNVVISLINWAFWNPVFKGVMGLTGNPSVAAALNPLAFVIFLTAYVTFIISALNKCFSAIHVIPSQVMGWIGGQGSPGGTGDAGEALSAVKGGTDSAASGASASYAEQKEKGLGMAANRGKRMENKKKPITTPGSSGSSGGGGGGGGDAGGDA